MGETINNILIGTANIADAAITAPKLGKTCDFSVVGFSDASGVQVDITGATKTYAAGDLKVGDVIVVDIALLLNDASATRVYLYLDSQLACSTQAAYAAATTGGTSMVRLHVVSATKVLYSQYQFYGATTNQVFAEGVITVSDISANAIILKAQHKATNATNYSSVMATRTKGT